MEKARSGRFITDTDRHTTQFRISTGNRQKGGYWLLGDPLGFERPLHHWPRIVAGPSHPEMVQPAVERVTLQLSTFEDVVPSRLRTRAEVFMCDVARTDSIVPTAYPTDEDAGPGVGFLWVAGGEKLLAELGATGDIYVRHVSADGRVGRDADLSWHDAVLATRAILESLSAKTRLAKGGASPRRYRNVWARD